MLRHARVADLSLSAFRDVSEDLRRKVAFVLGLSPGLVTVVDVADVLSDARDFGDEESFRSR